MLPSHLNGVRTHHEKPDATGRDFRRRMPGIGLTTARCNPAHATASNDSKAVEPLAAKPDSTMATTQPLNPLTAVTPATEDHVVHSIHTLLKYMFVVVPIVAGADKFANVLANWESYLNPLALGLVPVSPGTLMHLVGVIEIVAGILVFVRPRIGGFVVMAWLLAIAAQFLVWGRFLDIAVRDIVIALSGPLTLARLSPLVPHRR